MIDELMERTPEQQAAIEARKIFLIEERDRKEDDRQRRARTRVIDVDATARKLLKLKKVSQHWIDRKTPDQLRHFVKVACIAYQIDAISITGAPISVLSLMIVRNR